MGVSAKLPEWRKIAEIADTWQVATEVFFRRPQTRQSFPGSLGRGSGLGAA